MMDLIEKLTTKNDLDDDGLLALITSDDPSISSALAANADRTRRQIYGNKIYIRGLIEFTNYCKNDCLYCGIRCSNTDVDRYRLSQDEILECCKLGYSLGFRTFVLQGGEDPLWTDENFIDTVGLIHRRFKDCAITLSAGEKKRETYKALFDAGADRYLLRHETFDPVHYRKLHPANMSRDARIRCLYELKEIGFQTGCGFMVGSPYQTKTDIVKDLRFIKNFQPEMVGIGPFLPADGTPFSGEPCGDSRLTIKLLSIVRLLLPNVLLPATTALGTADSYGRERAVMAGANVVMPNLSPSEAREKYMLYNGKITTGQEAAESIQLLKDSMNSIGYEVVTERGDFIK